MSLKTRLAKLHKIVAQEVTVPEPVQPGVPAATATPNANPAQPQQTLDVNTLTTMIPNLMTQLNSSNINTVQTYLTQNMKVDPAVAQQATTAYAVKIYREEKAKRQNQLVQDVAKKMGLNPEIVQGWDKAKAPTPLPGTAARFRRKKILSSIVSEDRKRTTAKLNKYAEIDDIFEKVNNMSTQEKIENLKKFFSKFSDIKQGVEAILEFIEKFVNIQPPSGPPMVAAQLSKHIGVVAALLWIVSFIIWFGAAGTSDFDSKYWYLHPDRAQEAKAIALAIKSTGLAVLVQSLAGFFYKQEQKKSKKVI